MRCPDCGHTLRDPPAGQCPRCRASIWTGADLPRLVARLLHPPGACRCVVCGRELTGTLAGRCPHCAARFRAAV